MNRAVPLLIIFVTVTALAAALPVVKAQTYTYTLHGPYYDDGGVANADVGVAVLWIDGEILRFTMHGDGVTANTTTFTSSTPAYQMLWNASTALNFTRVVDFIGEETEEYNIYVPSPLVPAGLYVFTVTDFTSMVNPFLQTSISTDGTTSNVVERRSLNSTGSITFTMAQYGTYTLTVLCNQGSFSQTFTAENIFSTDIPVLAGVFPSTNSSRATLTASRLNSSMVGVAYSDPSNLTDWLFFNITHRQGTLTIFDYTSNNTGSAQTVLWNLASADKAYTVTAIASISGATQQWILAVPKLASANPWLGIFDFLGNYTATLPHVQSGWPEGMTSVQIAQLVASCIIGLFLGIGSFRSAGACCVLAWIVGLIMLYLGWFGGGTPYAAIPNFALAGFLSIIIVLDEGKQTVREV